VEVNANPGLLTPRANLGYQLTGEPERWRFDRQVAIQLLLGQRLKGGEIGVGYGPRLLTLLVPETDGVGKTLPGKLVTHTERRGQFRAGHVGPGGSPGQRQPARPAEFSQLAAQRHLCTAFRNFDQAVFARSMANVAIPCRLAG